MPAHCIGSIRETSGISATQNAPRWENKTLVTTCSTLFSITHMSASMLRRSGSSRIHRCRLLESGFCYSTNQRKCSKMRRRKYFQDFVADSQVSPPPRNARISVRQHLRVLHAQVTQGCSLNGCSGRVEIV